MTQNKIHRLPDVIAAVGLRRSSIYAAVAAGTFPRAVKLGARAVGWRESDIAAWLAERPENRPQVGVGPSKRGALATATTRRVHR